MVVSMARAQNNEPKNSGNRLKLLYVLSDQPNIVKHMTTHIGRVFHIG